MRKVSRHCTVMLHVCERLPSSNSLQRHQKHDHMTLSSSDIEANIEKMRETLKSDVAQEVEIFRQIGIFEKFFIFKGFEKLC